MSNHPGLAAHASDAGLTNIQDHGHLNLLALHQDAGADSRQSANGNSPSKNNSLPSLTLTDQSAQSAAKGTPAQHGNSDFWGGVGNFLVQAAKDAALINPITAPLVIAAEHPNEVAHAAQGVANIATDLGKGAWNEVTQHPGDIIKDVAVGAVFGAAMVLAPEVAIPVAAGLLVEEAIAHGKGETLDPMHPIESLQTIGESLIDPIGDVKALVKTGEDIGTGAQRLASDTAVDFDPAHYSQARQDTAHEDIQGVGAFGAQMAAGAAGGLAGGFAAGTIEAALTAAPEQVAATTIGSDQTVALDAQPPADMSPEEIQEFVTNRAQSNGVLNMVKSGDVEYNVEHIDPQVDPYGRVFSSTERPMTLQNNVTVQTPAGLVELKAGTTLPNGVQFSPAADVSVADNGTVTFTGGKLIAPDGGATLSDGTVINSGDLVGGENGSAPAVTLDRAAIAKPGDNILQRPSLDLRSGQPRIDTYAKSDATLAKGMVPKPGTDNIYTPKVDATNPTIVKAVPLNDSDKVSFMASYGEQVSNSAPTHVVVEQAADGTLTPKYLLSHQDAWETYAGADAQSQAYFDNQIGNISQSVGFDVPRAPATTAGQ